MCLSKQSKCTASCSFTEITECKPYVVELVQSTDPCVKKGSSSFMTLYPSHTCRQNELSWNEATIIGI